MSDDGGLSRLQKRLLAIPEAIRRDVDPALDKNAEKLAGLMRRLAPDDTATGAPDLKSSIRVEMGHVELRRAVVAGGEATTVDGKNGPYDYAFGQELGTNEMQANPYFYPAKRLLAQSIKRSLAAAARKAVRKNWGQS